MQNLRPESPIQLAERPLGLQRDPDAVEKFLRAPRATILVVLQNDLETGILHLQLVAPRPNTGEAFDPDLHFNSLTQTIIAKCEVGAFPTDTGSVAYNILRAEVMQDLQAMYPDVGNWDLILLRNSLLQNLLSPIRRNLSYSISTIFIYYFYQ
jgi:hypothetical protein